MNLVSIGLERMCKKCLQVYFEIFEFGCWIYNAVSSGQGVLIGCQCVAMQFERVF